MICFNPSGQLKPCINLNQNCHSSLHLLQVTCSAYIKQTTIDMYQAGEDGTALKQGGCAGVMVSVGETLNPGVQYVPHCITFCIAKEVSFKQISLGNPKVPSGFD